MINEGLEAPRNSLELDEPVTERKSVSSSLSSSSTMKVDEQNLNIPVSQIVTVIFFIIIITFSLPNVLEREDTVFVFVGWGKGVSVHLRDGIKILLYSKKKLEYHEYLFSFVCDFYISGLYSNQNKL